MNQRFKKIKKHKTSRDKTDVFSGKKSSLKNILTEVLFSTDEEINSQDNTTAFELHSSEFQSNEFEMVEASKPKKKLNHERYKFKLNKIEICKQEISAQELDGRLYVIGDIESFDQALPVYMDWPSKSNVQDWIDQDLIQWGSTNAKSIHPVSYTHLTLPTKA